MIKFSHCLLRKHFHFFFTTLDKLAQYFVFFQIVMEYCGAGSVSDIMRLRRKTLNEEEIGAVLRDTLKGLTYLHDLKKIHRDIKWDFDQFLKKLDV